MSGPHSGLIMMMLVTCCLGGGGGEVESFAIFLTASGKQSSICFYLQSLVRAVLEVSQLQAGHCK